MPIRRVYTRELEELGQCLGFQGLVEGVWIAGMGVYAVRGVELLR